MGCRKKKGKSVAWRWWFYSFVYKYVHKKSQGQREAGNMKKKNFIKNIQQIRIANMTTMTITKTK